MARDDLREDPLRVIRPGEYYTQTASRVMAPSPLVSVIVIDPGGARLADALDSIALQTYPNIEILVVVTRGVGDVDPMPRQGRFVVRTIRAPAACQPGWRVMTTLVRPGRGLNFGGRESQVLRPMITAQPRVWRLKCARSSGRCQGRVLLAPMTPLLLLVPTCQLRCLVRWIFLFAQPIFTSQCPGYLP